MLILYPFGMPFHDLVLIGSKLWFVFWLFIWIGLIILCHWSKRQRLKTSACYVGAAGTIGLDDGWKWSKVDEWKGALTFYLNRSDHTVPLKQATKAAKASARLCGRGGCHEAWWWMKMVRSAWRKGCWNTVIGPWWHPKMMIAVTTRRSWGMRRHHRLGAPAAAARTG